ncbi:hypothetical protein LZC95_28585 [Pendulispora brunnea]|uniref:Extracellular membrane protein CFEM domain-containing protein n=1 Tax=Pendulispora brunnea TaxID=2905690 RepID=A0ABZ2JVC0_9BACT
MIRKAVFLWIAVAAAMAFACGSSQTTTETTPSAATLSGDAGPKFAYCPPSNFANCTIASCEPEKDGYLCKCFADNRYSATAYDSGCKPQEGDKLQSRYHPVDSYQECTNAKTQTPQWAWCLGQPCELTPNGVFCHCIQPPSGVSAFPYVVVTPRYKASACALGQTGKYWSSASPKNVSQITAFLQAQPGLKGLPAPEIVLTPKQ